MERVKRLEIILDQGDLSGVLDSLSELGIRHYTAIEGVGGLGDRGRRGGDPFSGTFDNAYVLIACSIEQADKVVEMIGPVLKRLGGICLVSDAQMEA